MDLKQNVIIDFEKVLEDFEMPGTHISNIEFDPLNQALPTGFHDMDKHRYIRQGKSDLVVLAARPGAGKTALAMQIAANVSERYPVYFFSLEMAKDQLKQRLYALYSETSINKLHLLTENKKHELDSFFKTLDLRINDTNGLDINTLMSSAHAFAKKRRPALIVIDYLQIISPSKPGRSKAEEVAEISEKLKTLAKELSCPILTLAQMNRNVEGRSAYSKDPKPMMSDLADSSAIEKWSDVIFFMHRPYLINRERPGEADVFVAKNRHGPNENFTLGFSSELIKFFDFSKDSL
jgi:replicative DNA helicase